jgi:DNA-binding transcriptional regulator LsrR (DeoR family)
MRRVANLYYKEDRTKQEIAQQLHIDPRKVSWLIEQARALGVVKIDIRETIEGALQARLQRSFPALERVFIVPGPLQKTDHDWPDAYRRFGVLAADYFEELLEYHPRGTPFHVGVGGGLATFEFANALYPLIREQVHVHTTALVGRGELKANSAFVEPNLVATTLWTNCGKLAGHCDYVTVEPYWHERLEDLAAKPVSNPREVAFKEIKRLEKIKGIQKVIEDMNQLDVAFAGFEHVGHYLRDFDTIGVVRPENLPASSGFFHSSYTSDQIAQEGAVGVFSYCPYNADGVSDESWRFFLTAGHYSEHPGIDFYKQMIANGKKVVGLTGPNSTNAIVAALKAEIVNVLITDDETVAEIEAMFPPY